MSASRPSAPGAFSRLDRAAFPGILFLFWAASFPGAVSASPAPDAPVALAASDPRFRYEGRFDGGSPAAPVVIWQASRIAVDFEGDVLDVRFGGVAGQCFFNVVVDGATTVLDLRPGQAPLGAHRSGMGAGRHHLVLFKRSEAAAGTVPFLGLGLAAGAGAWAPAPPSYRLAMEFFGDSITAGACDEDGASDQWSDFRTHDNAVSFGALTAAAFGADYRNIAVSGMGVSTGWVAVRAAQIWDSLYPAADSARAPPSGWTPDVVLVNLGENDDSFPRAHAQPFPADFAARYEALGRQIRRSYPQAEIVLLRGGMFGGAQSVPLRDAWAAAVGRLEAEDQRIAHFVFTHWTMNHPRTADHRAMAGELIAWLQAQEFMRKYR